LSGDGRGAPRLMALLTAATGWPPDTVPPLPDSDDATGRTTLTSGGAPYELSVSTGTRPAAPAPLSYVLDLGTGQPNRAARLGVQRRALAAWAQRAEGGESATALAALLTDLVDVTLPGPDGLAAGAEFLTWLGAAHHPNRPAHIAALKVYLCLEAAEGALRRVAQRWPIVASLAGLFPPDLARPFAVSFTARVGALPGTAQTVTLYRPVAPGYEHQALETAATTLGAAGVSDALTGLGLGRLVWRGPMVLTTRCLLDPRAGPDGCPPDLAGLRFGVDLNAESFPADALAWSRRATEVFHGDTRAVDRLLAAVSGPDAPRPAGTSPQSWGVTWIGVESPAGAAIDRLSVYVAPHRAA